MSATETPESRRLARLIVHRDQLAAAIEDCDSKRDMAALSGRYVDVLEQIEALEKVQPAAKGTALDEFTRRRAEREASGPPRPAKRQQRG